MTGTWPEAVERVARFARETGAEVRIEEFSEETKTAVDAANAVGCSLAQIVKRNLPKDEPEREVRLTRADWERV